MLWSVRIFRLLRFGCVVDLDLLCRVPCWSWRVVELPRCFCIGSFVAREDITVSGCIGGR